MEFVIKLLLCGIEGQRMATYRQIQEYVKQEYGCTVKTCWIAHVKELNGLEVHTAPIGCQKRASILAQPTNGV